MKAHADIQPYRARFRNHAHELRNGCPDSSRVLEEFDIQNA